MVPVIPETAPFTLEQRAWLNGFFAGIFSRGPASPIAASASEWTAPAALTPLTILFGSQTGSAENLAKRAAREAGRRGFAATVCDMAQFDVSRLVAEQNVLVITSTYGDGEPPDNAKALHAALRAAAAGSSVSARSLRYSVCALGDTNYAQFCRCGQEFDLFLEKIGAQRLAPRVDCDLEYEEKFTTWVSAALAAFSAGSAATASGADRIAAPTPASTVAAEKPPSYSRANPLAARLLTSRRLNGEGSARHIHHVEFDLSGSELAYEPGDALGVVPHNCPALVTEVLTMLACDGEEAVPAPDGSTTSLRHALTERYDLGKPTPELLAILAPAAVGRAAALPAASVLHHVIDALVARTDVKLAPVEFVRALKRLQPRLYSISSSPRAHPGQVHLTVGAVRYEFHGRNRKGVCSTFLADRMVPGESRIGVFVHPNLAFRPPAAAHVPMIMVGPGTGIAPFRAFLHERKATGAKGRNWLFFGDQHAARDFLYRDELATLMHDGILTRLDTAFSRDQPQKIYVQHRMLEHASELFAWLEAGAHLYVCGDASRMAKDVDAALHTVVECAGGKTAEQAAVYVQALRSAKRYARDVY